MPIDFFKISIIGGAMTICQYRKEHPECDLDNVLQILKDGPAYIASYDYEHAVQLGELIGWNAFVIDGYYTENLRDTLKSMVFYFRPPWLQSALLGRNLIKLSMSDDELQCLEQAGLFENICDANATKWWDEVAAYARKEKAEQQMATGREGERKSLEYEQSKLREAAISENPIWMGLDDNRLGYDIKSFKRNDESQIIDSLIEVKATRFSPIQINISQNEWRTAQRNADKYIFHVWDLRADKLKICTVSEMEKHIPTNQNKGEWASVKVTFPI